MSKIDFNQQLLEDFIVVQMTESLSTRIKLPDWQKILRGKVIAVGPGKMLPNGAHAPMECQVGDVVTFAPTAGMDSTFGARVSVRRMHDTDVDTIVTEEEAA